MAEVYFYTSRDLVEVTRCKDCRNLRLCGGNTRNSKNNWCVIFAEYVNPDDYCSRAEELEEEDE